MARPATADRASRPYPGRYASMEWQGSVRNVATKSPIWRLGLFVPEWAAQGAKAQIPGRSRSVRQRAFGRPRRIPGGALHIRDQLHLVSGKFSKGQADHYILPAVPCPVIHARGDLDDRISRWQNRQTAMLARTRPGPAAQTGGPPRGILFPLPVTPCHVTRFAHRAAFNGWMCAAARALASVLPTRCDRARASPFRISDTSRERGARR